MHLEIKAEGLFGKSDINSVFASLRDFYDANNDLFQCFDTIDTYTAELCEKTDTVYSAWGNIGICDTQVTQKDIAAKTVETKTNDFLNQAIKTDDEVATYIANTFSDFAAVNPWASIGRGYEDNTSLWDSIWDALNAIGNGIVEVFDTIGEFIVSVGKSVWEWYIANKEEILSVLKVVCQAILSVIAAVAFIVAVCTPVGWALSICAAIGAGIIIGGRLALGLLEATGADEQMSETDAKSFASWKGAFDIAGAILDFTTMWGNPSTWGNAASTALKWCHYVTSAATTTTEMIDSTLDVIEVKYGDVVDDEKYLKYQKIKVGAEILNGLAGGIDDGADFAEEIKKPKAVDSESNLLYSNKLNNLLDTEKKIKKIKKVTDAASDITSVVSDSLSLGENVYILNYMNNHQDNPYGYQDDKVYKSLHEAGDWTDVLSTGAKITSKTMSLEKTSIESKIDDYKYNEWVSLKQANPDSVLMHNTGIDVDGTESQTWYVPDERGNIFATSNVDETTQSDFVIFLSEKAGDYSNGAGTSSTGTDNNTESKKSASMFNSPSISGITDPYSTSSSQSLIQMSISPLNGSGSTYSFSEKEKRTADYIRRNDTRKKGSILKNSGKIAKDMLGIFDTIYGDKRERAEDDNMEQKTAEEVTSDSSGSDGGGNDSW